jgi:hypothetical protein
LGIEPVNNDAVDGVEGDLRNGVASSSPNLSALEPSYVMVVSRDVG